MSLESSFSLLTRDNKDTLNTDKLELNGNSTSSSGSFKCLPCHKRRLKCDMGTPTCNKCFKRGVDCIYVFRPPRIRRSRDRDYQSFINKFSAKEDLDKLDESKGNNDKLKQYEGINPFIDVQRKFSVPNPNSFFQFEYDKLIDLSIVEAQNSDDLSQHEPSSSLADSPNNNFTDSTPIVKSNCSLSSNLSICSNVLLTTLNNLTPNNPNPNSFPETLTAPIIIPSNIQSSNPFELLINLAQNAYFDYINPTDLLFPCLLNKPWNPSEFLTFAITGLGLFYINQNLYNFNELRSIIENTLLNHINSPFHKFTLDYLQAKVLCHQIAYYTRIYVPLFPSLSNLEALLLAQCNQIAGHLKEQSSLETYESNPYYEYQLKATCALLASNNISSS